MSNVSNKHVLGRLMLKLFTDEPFYAGVMLAVRRIPDRSIGTAGVAYEPKLGRFVLRYNPDFINGMKTEQQLAVMKHEMMHIIYKHVTDRKAPIQEYGMQIWNWATDLAINSPLKDELPRFVVLPDGEVKEFEPLIPGEGKFKDYPLGMGAEWYLQKILNDDNIKKIAMAGRSGEGKGGGESSDEDGVGDMIGDHSGWSNDGDEEQESMGKSGSLEKAELNRVLKEGRKRAMTQSWGSVPQSMREHIEALLESHVDWRSVLRYFVRGTQRADKYSSFKSYNRRYPYQQPGRRVRRTARIAIAIDQSGSVGDHLLAKFFAELNALAKLATFDVVPFDSIVHEDKVFTWKKGSKKKTERVASGGTNFDAPTEYVNENKEYDALIILTDMCAPKPQPCRVARMWITEKQYEQYCEKVADRDLCLVIP